MILYLVGVCQSQICQEIPVMRRNTRDNNETQKVIIPRGLAGAENGVIVVHIPKRHEKDKVVVAQPMRSETARKRASKVFVNVSQTGGAYVSTPTAQNVTRPTSRQVQKMVQPPFNSPPAQYRPSSQPPVQQQTTIPTPSTGPSVLFTVTSNGQLMPIRSIVIDDSLKQPSSTPWNENRGSSFSRPDKSSNIPFDLDQTEYEEREQLQTSLDNFQKARRNFLKDAISFAGELAAANKDDDSY